MSIRLFYDRWPQYNRRLVEIVRPMTAEQLAVRPAPDLLPIWATVGHSAAMRVYWLCEILGEPGAETTPFVEPMVGWEDDLSRPRNAEELVTALETTFAIVGRCLDTWTPAMMTDEIERYHGDLRQVHTRTSVTQRLFSHDAWHCGELSQTLGLHGLPQPDLWRPD